MEPISPLGWLSIPPPTTSVLLLPLPSPQQPKGPRAWQGSGAEEGMARWMWGEGGLSQTIPSGAHRPSQWHTPHRAAAAPRYLDLRHHDPRLRVLVQHAGDQVLQVLSYVRPGGDRHVRSLKDRYVGPLKAQRRRWLGTAGRYSLLWKFQGLALDLTV